MSKNDSITTLAIGKFESMHLAHKAVIGSLGDNGAILLIKIPREKGGFIVPYRRREHFAQREMYYANLSEIKDMSGAEFLAFVGERLPYLRTIIVGNDFRFGKNRQNTASDIEQISPFKTRIIQEMSLDGIPVHSSFIRSFIINGDVESANKLLGRFYSIDGEVIAGQGLGRREIFPTINLSASEYLLPQNGVYATLTRIRTKRYQSLTFIGNRLSTNGSFAIETHILGTNIALAPKTLEIFFVKKLRDNRKFNNLSALKAQIALDMQRATRYFTQRSL